MYLYRSGKTIDPCTVYRTPLDANHQIHKTTICELLSKTQAKKFDINPPKDEAWKTAVGPQCHIEAGEYGLHDLLINIDKNNSLRKTYTNKKSWSYFKSSTIEGYPLVSGSNTDYRDMGGCTVTLGITNKITATIIYDRPDGTNEKSRASSQGESRGRS